MKLFIFGSGGAAQDIVSIVDARNSLMQESIEICGFIGVENGDLKVGDKVFKVFREIDFFAENIEQDCQFAIGISNCDALKSISQKFSHLQFPNLIHPSVQFHSKSVSIQSGNIIPAGCVLSTNIEIGSFNYFGANVTVGHDSVIGKYNVLNPGCVVSGNTTMTTSVFLGANATVLQGLSISSGSIVGAGAVVTRSLESAGTYVGVPARKLK